MAGNPSDDASARETLRRLAAALGRPVEDFFQDEAGSTASGRLDLLSLWDGLTTEASRQAVLRVVRAVARSEGG